MVSDGDPIEECRRLIPLDQLDFEDERFRITACCDSTDLQPSLKRFGLLSAPLLLPTEKGFSIVSGFRRANACRELRWDWIPARILDRQTPAYECALRAVAENSAVRPLNLVETSRALVLLDQYAPGGQTPLPDILALGLPANPGLASKLKTLCCLPVEVQAAVIAEAVSFSMAYELSRLPADLAVGFARLFQHLRTSLNKQREIVTMVCEIAFREELDPQEVLGDPALVRVQELVELDHNQKTRHIRSLLRRRRFPSLVAAEERFLALRQRLKLGDTIKLTPPKDFEGTRFTLTVSFESRIEIDRLRAKLDELADQPDFKTLLTGKSRAFGEN